MSLKEQGFRFCISPDKERARWIHPVEYATRIGQTTQTPVKKNY